MTLGSFIIQSHRGAGVLAPENSLEAFELGWRLGCWPEADVRTTRDGVIVAFHDGDFSKMASISDPATKKRGVADLTWDELSTLELGNGRRVCRIDDVFGRMVERPERRLYLDVKRVDLAQLAVEVQRHQIDRQV